MKMREGFRKLFENGFSKQVALFSVCGIIGLFDAYVSINGINTLMPWEKLAYAIMWIIFAFFIIGFETKFLHERQIPEIDIESFKLTCNKVLFIIFLAGLPLLTAKFYPQYSLIAFAIELILAIPFTLIQAGFSYNYDENEAFFLLKKLNLADYTALLIKRIWIIFISYITVFSIVFFIFFASGIIISILYRGDATYIAYAISSNKLIISKLSSFISEILLIYALTIGTLVWDYETVKTYEREEK